jgi:hypothetical protein
VLSAECRSRPPSEADSRALLLHADQAGRQAVSKAAAAIDEILATQIRDLEASLAARGATRRRARSRRTRTGRGARQCRNRFADLGDGQSAERFSQCMLIKAALCQSSGILTHVAQRCAGPIASKTRIKSKGLDGCDKLASTPQVGRGQRELVLVTSTTMAQLAMTNCRETDGFGRSHSLSFDHRLRPDTLRTAMATAFFCPTSTTSFLPRVTPV